MKRFDLGGEWELIDLTSGKRYPAKLPGSNYGALIALGEIPDPFLGTDEARSYWVYEHDWSFVRLFELPSEVASAPFLFLVFERLDTLAHVIVNGKEALFASDAHRVWRIDGKKFLRAGENRIEIRFDSPVKYIEKKQKEDKMPFNSNGLDGIPHIRKAQCHFGWDWGPIIPLSGATAPLRIEYGDVRLSRFEVLSSLSEDRGQGMLKLFAEGAGGRALRYEITSPKGEITRGRGRTGEEILLPFPSPELWWTADVSGKAEQPLYTVRVVLEGENGESEDEALKRVGFRTLKLDRAPDEYGTQFRFVLNGIPLFAKGANWIPADSLPERITALDYDFYLRSMRDAGQNMVRVWGGGSFESETFYDLCDRYGILVWQDCPFACQPYPFYNEAFTASVLKEIEENLLRLRHRASLALLCGNNEIEAMTGGWLAMRRLIEANKEFFWHTLPEHVAKWAPETPYIPGSPVGTAPLKDVSSDAHGDTHLWQVWHGLKPLTFYRTRSTRFCSEFGLESLPDIRTVRDFAGEGEFTLSSPVFNAHQKCASGNNKMLFYTATRFRLPGTLDELSYLTQIVQEECVRDATEHFRRNRGKCNGSLYWQLNDCWPVSSWSSIDYYKRYKVLQYRAKEFSAPLTLSLEENKKGGKVWLLNDCYLPFSGHVRARVMTFRGQIRKEIERAVNIGAAQSKELFSLSISPSERKRTLLVAELFDRQGRQIARRIALFAPEKALLLPPPELSARFETDGNAVKAVLKSKNFARFVRLNTPYGAAPFPDQAFDLLPGEERILSLPVPERLSPEEYARSLTAASVFDFSHPFSKFKELLLVLKIRLIPINIANAIVYSFM